LKSWLKRNQGKSVTGSRAKVRRKVTAKRRRRKLKKSI